MPVTHVACKDCDQPALTWDGLCRFHQNVRVRTCPHDPSRPPYHGMGAYRCPECNEPVNGGLRHPKETVL
jgi:hypothetical protein